MSTSSMSLSLQFRTDLNHRSLNRQCIDFDKLTLWRKENTIDMDKYVEVMKKPKGVEEAPMTDMFFELYGNLIDPNHAHSHGGSIT